MDLKVIQARSTLPITGYTVVNASTYPQVEVRGVGGFTNVTSVEINGVKANSISVINDARILASIPSGVQEIITVDVYTSNRGSGTYKVRSGLGVEAVSGVDKVAQKVVKVLLTSPGSDLRNPDLGAGLRDIIGRAFTNFGELSAEVALTIRAAEEQIKRVESASELEDSDKLGSIMITRITPLHKDGVSIDIEITNKLGDISRIGVPL